MTSHITAHLAIQKAKEDKAKEANKKKDEILETGEKYKEEDVEGHKTRQKLHIPRYYNSRFQSTVCGESVDLNKYVKMVCFYSFFSSFISNPKKC